MGISLLETRKKTGQFKLVIVKKLDSYIHGAHLLKHPVYVSSK